MPLFGIFKGKARSPEPKPRPQGRADEPDAPRRSLVGQTGWEPGRRTERPVGSTKKPPPPLDRAGIHQAGEPLGVPAKSVAPPKRAELAQRAGAAPLAFVGRAHAPRDKGATPAYLAILPPNFDGSGSTRYPVVTVSPPTGHDFKEVLAALGDSLPVREGAVIVVTETKDAEALPGIEASGGAAVEHVLSWIDQEVPLDFDQHRELELGDDPAAWSTELATQSGKKSALRGPVAYVNGEWRRCAVTRNWDHAFPPPAGQAHAQIPEALAKQTKDRGTFFALVAEDGGFGGKRMGAYLPPGYDPSSPERYPVLVLLPGAGNPLHRWTSAGQLVPTLDQLMKGEGQKMIVMVADQARTDRASVQELLDYALRDLKGDPARVGLAGISAGAGGAARFAEAAGDRVKTLSLHSGMLPKAREWLADRRAPTLFVDAGYDEADYRKDAVRFCARLNELGAKPELHVHKGDRELNHRWSSWSEALPSWIAFHQKALGGQAGQVPARPGVRDVASELEPEPEKSGWLSSWW